MQQSAINIVVDQPNETLWIKIFLASIPVFLGFIISWVVKRKTKRKK